MGCTSVLLLLSRWQDKRRSPLRGTEGGSEERTEPFEPSHGARKERRDERVALRRARSHRVRARSRRLPLSAPRATRRFLCPAFFGSGRQRKRAGFCSFWPGSKRRRMRTTRKCPGSLPSCRGIISSKTALSDHRACERSESSGIPDPTRWPRSP